MQGFWMCHNHSDPYISLFYHLTDIPCMSIRNACPGCLQTLSGCDAQKTQKILTFPTSCSYQHWSQQQLFLMKRLLEEQRLPGQTLAASDKGRQKNHSLSALSLITLYTVSVFRSWVVRPLVWLPPCMTVICLSVNLFVRPFLFVRHLMSFRPPDCRPCYPAVFPWLLSAK